MAKIKNRYYSRLSDDKKLRLYKIEHTFKSSIRILPPGEDEKLEKIFERRLRPQFETLWKRHKGKKKGFDFIFRVEGSMNFSGGRRKFGFGTPRIVGLNRKSDFEKAMNAFLNGPRGMLAKFQTYLGRKALRSLVLRAITVQVTGAKLKTAKKRKRKHKTIRRRRR